MSCETCFKVSLPDCEDSIAINLALTPATNYFCLISDKFGNKYKILVTTDANGNFVIQTKDFPKGLFTKFSGDFLFRVYDLADALKDFTIDAKSYSCITLDFKNTDDKISAIP